MTRQSGFTLIEIATVMIIGGLLLGAILKAQEIIINAKIKNLENQYKSIAVALYSYQERYGTLPGDDKHATAKFSPNLLATTVASIHNGNGNGNIQGAFDDTSPDTKESCQVWAHLRLAGLIEGIPGSTELPIHAFAGIIGVSSQTDIFGRTPVTIAKTFIGISNIPNAIAIILETRADDNQPHTGLIQTEEFSYTDPSLNHKLYFEL